MAQESTAINQLIHLVQGKRLEVDDDPVPELFAVPPSRPAAAPARVATGTRPPPVAAPAPAPAAAPRPAPAIVRPLPAMPAQQYRIPTVVHHDDDEQTEMWNNSALDTSPPVPKILPHVATMIAQPQVAAVPSILRGPIAPQPQAMPSRGPDALPPQAAMPPRGPIAPQPPAAHAVPYAHVVLPPQVHAVSPGFPAPVVPPIAPPSPAPYLVVRELLSSAIRSWGGIAALAVVALGVGAYLAIASRGDDKPRAPSDRDRAIAIMNGTAQPDPPSVKAPPSVEPVVVTAPAPTAPTVTAEPIALPIAAAAPVAPTSEPIEDTPAAEPEPAADEVAVDDIEMDPVAARPSKRAARSSRARKTVAVAQPVSARPARSGGDPVLALLAEKPAKAKAAKPARDEAKPSKPLKVGKHVVATEIAAPRGAAAANGTGKVTITSDRAALVFLDGRPTGKSAPTALVIPAGDHQITLLDPASKKAKTATIQLAANKTLTVQKLFD